MGHLFRGMLSAMKTGGCSKLLIFFHLSLEHLSFQNEVYRKNFTMILILKTNKLSEHSLLRDDAYRIGVSVGLCFAREHFQHGEYVSHLSHPELKCGVALRTGDIHTGKNNGQEVLMKMSS